MIVLQNINISNKNNYIFNGYTYICIIYSLELGLIVTIPTDACFMWSYRENSPLNKFSTPVRMPKCQNIQTIIT